MYAYNYVLHAYATTSNPKGVISHNCKPFVHVNKRSHGRGKAKNNFYIPLRIL